MNWQFVAAVVLLFLMVLLGFGAAYEWWRKNRSSEAKRINERLENLSSGVIDARKDVESILKSRRLSESSLLNSALEQLPSTRMLDQYLLQAGLRWSVGYFVGLSATLGLAVLIVLGLLRFPALTALPIAALCLFLPTFYVRYKHAKRLQKFEQQLPEACDMLARALRSGHAFTSAMQMVGTEFADPMGTEFRLAFGEINYGVPIGEALTNLVKRVPIRDLRYFVIAVLIQRETGGNLAELLDNITALIRERFKLYDRVRVLSAEGRLSVWVMASLPIATGAMIYLMNPAFISVLWTDKMGLWILGAALVLLVIGVFWTSRVVKIRV